MILLGEIIIGSLDICVSGIFGNAKSRVVIFGGIEFRRIKQVFFVSKSECPKCLLSEKLSHAIIMLYNVMINREIASKLFTVKFKLLFDLI